VIILPVDSGSEYEDRISQRADKMKSFPRRKMYDVMKICEQDWLSKLSRPSRYLDNEINTILKDSSKTEVSMALVFPDVPEVGMSHLGLKIIYHLLERPGLAGC
jgi:hypothetical protein